MFRYLSAREERPLGLVVCILSLFIVSLSVPVNQDKTHTSVLIMTQKDSNKTGEGAAEQQRAEEGNGRPV